MSDEDQNENEEQIAEDFLEDFKNSLEFRVDAGDQPVVDQEFGCLTCSKKNIRTKLIVTAIEKDSSSLYAVVGSDPQNETTDPLLSVECSVCKELYDMRLYFTVGLEVSLDFRRRVETVKPITQKEGKLLEMKKSNVN